jgi:hypothetical protein
MADQDKATVEGLMELVRQFGLHKFSKGLHVAKGLEAGAEDADGFAADCFVEIEAYATRLAGEQPVHLTSAEGKTVPDGANHA